MARWILLDGVVERSKRWSVRLSRGVSGHAMWPHMCGVASRLGLPLARVHQDGPREKERET
jgi:hypothetical protein